MISTPEEVADRLAAHERDMSGGARDAMAYALGAIRGLIDGATDADLRAEVRAVLDGLDLRTRQRETGPVRVATIHVRSCAHCSTPGGARLPGLGGACCWNPIGCGC